MPNKNSKQPVNHIEGKPTLASWIAVTLREKIVAGELPPNAKLNLEQLRDGFEISLSPLREAISRLVAEGLVELEDQRGFRVAPISFENLTEITLLRAELDALALRQSIAHADLDWEAAVTGATHRLVRASEESNDTEPLKAWIDALSDFHLHLLGGWGMPQLAQFSSSLRHQLNRYIRILDVFDAHICQSSATEYKAISEAAIARDEPLAVALLTAQIRRNGKQLTIALEEYLTQNPADQQTPFLQAG